MLLVSSNHIQAISHGPFWSNKLSGLFLIVPNQSVGCPWTGPHQASVPLLWNRNPWPFFTSQHGFLDKEYPSRRRPLPPRVIETPQYRYPRVALAVRINIASCLTGIDELITWKSRDKVEPLSLKFLLSLSSFFSLSIFPLFSPHLISWVRLGQENLSPHLPLVTFPLVPWISPYPLSIYHRFPPNHMLPHVSHGSHLSSMFDLLST